MEWSGGTSPIRAHVRVFTQRRLEVLGELFFGHACRCATTGAQRQWIRLSWSSGPSCVSPRRLWEEFWLLARAVRTWKYGASFRPGLVSDSYLFYVRGYCRVEYGKLDLRGDDFSGRATPASTVDTCYASVHLLAFGRISNIFQSNWTRTLSRFSVLTQNGEVCSMPQVVAHACAACT